MADLTSGTYEYSDLASKYKDFVIPAAKVFIEGTNVLDKDEFYLDELEASLSIETASMVKMKIAGCFDRKNSCINNEIKSKAVLGNEICVELGYGSDTEKIFKGYIASVRVEFTGEEGVVYSIIGLDVRRLMMAEKKTENHIEKTYSDVVKKVIGNYSKLCSLEIEDTSEQLNGIAQNGTDFDFIVKDIIQNGKVDREFFVLCDKAYFRKPKSVKSPVIKLNAQGEITSFRRDSRYLDQMVSIIGYNNMKDEEGIKEEKKIVTYEKQNLVMSEKSNIYIYMPNVLTKEEAKIMAERVAEKLLEESQTGELSCVGIPYIVPGRYVEVCGIDETINKKYYVVQAIHSYSVDNGYTTKCEFKGWC